MHLRVRLSAAILPNGDADGRRRSPGFDASRFPFRALIVWPSDDAVAFYVRAGFRPVSGVPAAPNDEPPLELVL